MDKTQAIAILEASNRLLLEEMTKLRKLLETGCAATDPDAPYATLEKCELEYAAVQTAIEAIKSQMGDADQVACTESAEYILRYGFQPEEVRRVPFSIEERLSNYQDNLANGFNRYENEISGIVVVELDDLITAYDPDPFSTVLNVLESKLIGGCMDNTSYSFVGLTGSGEGILVLVKGIDYEIAEIADEEDGES